MPPFLLQDIAEYFTEFVSSCLTSYLGKKNTVALFSTREFSLSVPLYQDEAIAITFFISDSSEDSEEQPFFKKSYF